MLRSVREVNIKSQIKYNFNNLMADGTWRLNLHRNFRWA